MVSNHKNVRNLTFSFSPPSPRKKILACGRPCWPADGLAQNVSALNLSADSHESIKCGQITKPSAGQDFELILSADKIKCGHFFGQGWIQSATLFPAEISSFRSRSQKFKMDLEALTRLFYLPHQFLTDFDKFLVSGKRRLSALKWRKNRQNQI